MNKLKLMLIPIGVLLLTGCNYDLVDTNYTYDTAICEIGGEYEEIDIKKWTDYEDGEQIQIIDEDGNVYLVSTYNCTLINEK